MCQLFMRTNTRERLLSSGKWPKVEATFWSPSVLGNAVEHCCVADRHALIQAAEYLLSEWPRNFLGEMIESDISRSLFFGATHMHPPWIDDVINRNLAKQNRWVTEEDVRRVVASLQQEGVRLTKAEIWRRLNWWGRIDPKWLI